MISEKGLLFHRYPGLSCSAVYHITQIEYIASSSEIKRYGEILILFLPRRMWGNLEITVAKVLKMR
jgi:hypothetical protein